LEGAIDGFGAATLGLSPAALAGPFDVGASAHSRKLPQFLQNVSPEVLTVPQFVHVTGPAGLLVTGFGAGGAFAGGLGRLAVWALGAPAWPEAGSASSRSSLAAIDRPSLRSDMVPLPSRVARLK